MRLPILILAAGTLAMTACSRGGSDPDAFRWATELPAGAVVHLRSGSGAIEVHRSGGQNVVVNGSRRWTRGRSRDVQFQVVQHGSDYFVCAMWRNSGDCSARGYHGNRPGFLSMLSLFHRSDASADFVADVPSNVVIDALTTNGSVNVDGLTAGVTARTSNGNVKATNVGGPVSLTTSNGNVELVADTLSGTDPINLQTKNGVIQAELPADLEGVFDLSALNGSVRTDFPLTVAPSNRGISKRIHGQIGNSGRSVKMRTLNGSVVLTARGTITSHE